eukprot:1189978-Prorocentrum_minimum.AAC.3
MVALSIHTIPLRIHMFALSIHELHAPQEAEGLPDGGGGGGGGGKRAVHLSGERPHGRHVTLLLRGGKREAARRQGVSAVNSQPVRTIFTAGAANFHSQCGEFSQSVR